MTGKEGTLLITSQIGQLLRLLTNFQYTSPIPVFHGGTIGQHMRHILEFYSCLLNGVQCTTVDYTSRKRNLVLSENKEAALATLDYIESEVAKLVEHQGLQIINEYSNEDDINREECFSSVGRELQYAFDHAVHHLAIIRIGIECTFPAVPIDPDLGIAPSTLKFRNFQLNALPSVKVMMP
jgi:uncharacterized damage-inducible protein DinB